MQLERRSLLSLAAAGALLPALSLRALGETYPSRPVKILVGFAPGGAADFSARLMGQWLFERLGQPFVVESRTGAASAIATEAVVKATPDGATLLLVTPANAINASLYDKLSFNFLTDTAPVAGIFRFPNIQCVNPAFPAKTVSELIAHAKANPGKLSYASAGVGTASHLAGELFKQMTGVEMAHIPYRGNGPAVLDLIGGHVDVLFADMASSVQQVRSGKLHALAVTTAQRSPALPDVPSIAETVPGYDASSWFGLSAPKDTPADIVATLNREINAGLAEPKLQGQFANMGATAFTGSSAEFGAFIAAETEKWAKVVKTAGIKAE